jgi:drug/metabolite transporter (DMT)-like permease
VIEPRIRRGPLLMIGAGLLFTLMLSLVKIARTDLGLTAAQVMFWRGLLGVPFAVALVGAGWRIRRPGVFAVRCLFGAATMFCSYSAARGLGLGELTVIAKLQPLLVAAFAPLALGRGERPDRGVLGAIALGLAGTAVLVSPHLCSSEVSRAQLPYVGFALASAVSSAIAHTSLRALGASESPQALVLWFQVAVAGAALGVAVGEGSPIAPATLGVGGWALLIGVGGFAWAGQLLQTHAYRLDGAARIAAASYVTPLLGFLLDAALFRALPGLPAVIGALLVLSAGWMVLRRAGSA